jgi:hypothetical protein
MTVVISASRISEYQGLTFSMYVGPWVLKVWKSLNSPCQAVNWIAAHAGFKWEKLKATPHPPLKLSIGPNRFQLHGTWFSFDIEGKGIVVDDNSE